MLPKVLAIIGANYRIIIVLNSSTIIKYSNIVIQFFYFLKLIQFPY